MFTTRHNIARFTATPFVALALTLSAAGAATAADNYPANTYTPNATSTPQPVSSTSGGVVAGVGNEAEPGTQYLAQTGSDIAVWAAGAAGLVLVGGAVVIGVRRHASNADA